MSCSSNPCSRHTPLHSSPRICALAFSCSSCCRTCVGSSRVLRQPLIGGADHRRWAWWADMLPSAIGRSWSRNWQIGFAIEHKWYRQIGLTIGRVACFSTVRTYVAVKACNASRSIAPFVSPSAIMSLVSIQNRYWITPLSKSSLMYWMWQSKDFPAG